MSIHKLPSSHAQFRGLLIGALACTVAGLSAVAQPGPGLSPEDQAKAMAAEAKTLAADLKLDADKSEKLASTYSAARKRSEESRPQGGGQGNMEAFVKHLDDQKALLTEDLKAFLEEAQAKQAADVLGSFNRGWDVQVLTILGFGLDEAKQTEALGHTLTYVKTVGKAWQDSRASQDFDALRTAATAAKKTLDDAIAQLVSDAQKAEWAEKTAWRQRG